MKFKSFPFFLIFFCTLPVFSQMEAEIFESQILIIEKELFSLDKDILEKESLIFLDSLLNTIPSTHAYGKKLRHVNLVLEERTDYSDCCEDITKRRADALFSFIRKKTNHPLSTIQIQRFQESAKKAKSGFPFHSPKIYLIYNYGG